jgi:gamma-glutamylcyclotransferase (GGCT)/AIG2-like uncharacterized protein YtfP
MKYFSYGSNLNIKLMDEKCPRAMPICSAILHNHILVFRGSQKGKGVADIKQTSAYDDFVFGGLYEIPDHYINILDASEHYPDIVDKKEIKVNLENGSTIKAFTYFLNGNIERTTLDSDYLNLMIQGYFYFSLPIEELQASIIKNYEASKVSKEGSKTPPLTPTKYRLIKGNLFSKSRF